MKIIFERNSICAGDDAYAPNQQEYSFEKTPFLSELLNEKTIGKYLPSVHQAKTYWSAIRGGNRVAHIEHSYVDERKVSIQLLITDQLIYNNKIFFKYEMQKQIDR